MKIYQGVIKKVPTSEQFELVNKNEINLQELTLHDTIRSIEKDDTKVSEVISFRVAYKEVDNSGKEKFIFNEKTGEYETIYKLSPIISAYGKELRIVLELGEYAPVKVVVTEKEAADSIYYNAVCIQDQRQGKKF